MRDLTKNYPGRECRVFWTKELKHVQGFQCDESRPPNKGYWWAPEAGFSGMEGQSLFAGKEDARAKGILDAKGRIYEAEKEIRRLEKA